MAPAGCSIEVGEALEGKYHLLNRVTHESRDAVHDHFWHGAALGGDHRRATGHRLDHRQAERLRPMDGEDEGFGSFQKVALLTLVDLADELYHIVVHQ